MATLTYILIQSQTLNSNVSSVTFSSIPATYTDLVLSISTQTTTNANAPLMRFNGDTGNNYSYQRISSNGSGIGADQAGNTNSIALMYIAGTTNTANTAHPCFININNYKNTSMYKVAYTLVGGPSEAGIYAGGWRSTSAIDTISLTANFASGQIFSLYGIKSE